MTTIPTNDPTNPLTGQCGDDPREWDRGNLIAHRPDCSLADHYPNGKDQAHFEVHQVWDLDPEWAQALRDELAAGNRKQALRLLVTHGSISTDALLEEVSDVGLPYAHRHEHYHHA